MNMNKVIAGLSVGLFAIAGITMADYHEDLSVECEYVEIDDSHEDSYLIFECSDIFGFSYYHKFSVEFVKVVVAKYFVPEIVALMAQARKNMQIDIEDVRKKFNRDVTEQQDNIQNLIIRILEDKFSDWEDTMESMKKRIIYLENELNDKKQTEYTNMKGNINQVFPPFTK